MPFPQQQAVGLKDLLNRRKEESGEGGSTDTTGGAGEHTVELNSTGISWSVNTSRTM